MPRLIEPSEGSELTELSEKSGNESEIEVRPTRPRRKSQKLREKEDLVSASEVDDSQNDEAADLEVPVEDDNSDSDSSLSPLPESPPKKKKIGRPRKSSTTFTKPAKPDTSTIPSDKAGDKAPAKPRRSAGGRGGGNKRKHPHEYCLTCANYGRACSGRRDDHPGCAVCREPDRSKGEKLRECLWAEPEKGIFTYAQAKEILKIAQAEERARQGKAPTKRQLPYLSEEQRKKYLSAPDMIGLVDSRARTAAAPPPVSRPLNLRPPPSGMRQRQLLSGIETHATRPDPYRGQEEDPDTIVLNREAPSSGSRSAPKLFVEEGSLDDHTSAAHTYTAKVAQPARVQPLTDATGRRIPYYDPNLEAYVLPAYPHSNLLPPHMDKVTNVTYLSVYEAYPFLPMVMPNARAHSSTDADLQNSNRPRSSSSNATALSHSPSSLLPLSSLYPGSPPKPLDKSGTPTRRYHRSDSIVSGVSGYDVPLKMWKSPVATHLNGNHKENASDDLNQLAHKSAKEHVKNTSSLSKSSSVQAPSRIDPIDKEHQPQVSRSRSLSLNGETVTDQAAILPAKYYHDPERKRKRFSRPASPDNSPALNVSEGIGTIVESVENTEQSVRNGRESSLSSAISLRSGSVPSAGRFSHPPIAEAIRKRQTSVVSPAAHSTLAIEAIDKVPTSVASSGWQAVNAVTKPILAAAAKVSPARQRKKRRTTTFDTKIDKGVKKE